MVYLDPPLEQPLPFFPYFRKGFAPRERFRQRARVGIDVVSQISVGEEFVDGCCLVGGLKHRRPKDVLRPLWAWIPRLLTRRNDFMRFAELCRKV